MSANANIQINIEGDVFVAIKKLKQQFNTLNKTVDKIESSSTKSFSSIGASLRALNIVSITQQFENMHATLDSFNSSGLSFESSLAELSAITGVTGEKLKELGNKARENAMVFGGEASDSVETYKLLLSQLGPELATKPEILDGMANSVSILSKTMKGDTAGAVEVLTTAMNQYGISLDDPIQAQRELNRMMNVMSAGAKEGSAELPALKAAIQNVGGDARRSKLSFEELVSAIEVLDKAGKKGAEGGVALRNVLSTLSKGRFLPKDVKDELTKAGVDINVLTNTSLKFTERLKELNKVSEDGALISKLFGVENKLAASALLEGIDAQEKLTKSITGTKVAEEQSAIIMNTTAEKMKRLNAYFSDWKIVAFDWIKSFSPVMSVMLNGMKSLSSIAPAITLITTLQEKLNLSILKGSVIKTKDFIVSKAMSVALKIKSFWLATVTSAQWLWNAAMSANPIGLVIIGITALVGAIAWLTDGFSGFGEYFTGFWEWLTEWFGSVVNFWNEYLNPFQYFFDAIEYLFPGAKSAIFDFFSSLWAGVYERFVQPFIDAWDWISSALGFGGEAPAISGEVKYTVATDNGDKPFTSNVTDKKVAKQYAGMPFGGSQSQTKQSSSDKSSGFASAEKKTINTKIDKLINQLIIQVPSVEMSKAKIKQIVNEALVGAIRDSEVALG